MKKLIAIILFAIMILTLVSCSSNGGGSSEKPTEAPTESSSEEATEAPTEAPTEEETEPVDERTLREKIDAFVEDGLCLTHGKFDILFNYAGASFTMENLTALIRSAIGLGDDCDVSIDQADFDDLFEEYQGSGDGGGGAGNGFVWPDPILVTFSDPATGETEEEEISFSFRKCLPSQEIYPNGVLGTCPEDGSQTLQAAYRALKTVEISEETPVYAEYDGEYTAEAVEAFFRELTGLDDAEAYGFYLVGFDPETRGEPFYALFCDKNAPEGHFDPVWIETAFE